MPDYPPVPSTGGSGLFGTAAARPAASNANKGFIYFATDTGVVSYSDGTTWHIATPGSTAVAATALINGTQTFITVTAPNDALPHSWLFEGILVVTTAETGGQLAINANANGINQPVFVSSGGLAAGTSPMSGNGPVDPNSAVTFTQSTALTAGAATASGRITIF